VNLRFVFLLIQLVSASAFAKTVYVTNNLDLPLRSSESSKSKTIGLLPIGTAVEVLNENGKTGFSQVQLKNGQQGYIATRNTVAEPPNRSQPGTIAANLSTLQTENNNLKEELAKIKSSISPDTPLEQSLAVERDRLDRELTELKRTASNQIQLKDERDALQEDVVNIKRELEQLKLENNALKDGAKQDWFLYGGMLSLAGVFLGFILPKLGWRRKNDWDRF
jgi:SH3 domain protein